jgi:hypothetical protein
MGQTALSRPGSKTISGIAGDVKAMVGKRDGFFHSRMFGVKENPHPERYFKRYSAKLCARFAIVVHHDPSKMD